MTADNWPKLVVQELRGLNERLRFSNPDTNEFDFSRNAVPQAAGSLTKALGCKLYQAFGVPILGIFQTFDSQRNIIVQTRTSVQVISEYDLFGIVQPTPVLVPFTPPPPPPPPAFDGDDEIYPEAFFVLPNNSGPWSRTSTGSLLVGNSYPVGNGTIAYQLNSDGTTASFLSIVSAYSLGLLPGVYRVAGYVRASGNAANYVRVQLSSTAGSLGIGASDAQQIAVTNENITLFFDLKITLSLPSQLSITRYSDAANTVVENNLFGAQITGNTNGMLGLRFTKTA